MTFFPVSINNMTSLVGPTIIELNAKVENSAPNCSIMKILFSQGILVKVTQSAHTSLLRTYGDYFIYEF